MKKYLVPILAAAALVVPGVAQARDNHGDSRDHRAQVVKVQKAKEHKWKRGERFDRKQATNYREINYRNYHRLKAPPRGYHYVRSGNDILLVALTSGVIGAVYGNLLSR